MLTPQSQGCVSYYAHGSLIILPTPLKNPQKVWNQEPQQYLWLVTTTFTKTSPLWEHLQCHASSRAALVINSAAYLKFFSGHKILHSPDDFHSRSVCFSQSAKEHKHRQTSARGRAGRSKNILMEDVDSKHQNLQLCFIFTMQNCSVARCVCTDALFCCLAFLQIVVLSTQNW